MRLTVLALDIIASDREIFDHWLHALWDAHRESISAGLAEAIAYSLFLPGKRIRPVMMIGTARLFTEDIGDAKPFACALEMIHTYSLIHDDLPAMDDDDLRRGQPTSHKVFGDATAILAGDALLTLAFEVVASSGYYPAKVLEALTMIASCAGATGMVGGQSLDLGFEARSTVTLEEIKKMATLKTAKLFIAACAVPAILFGESEDIERMTEFGRLLGLAFQAHDDLIDLSGDANTTGKKVGKDLSRNKKTFAFALEADEIRSFVADTTTEAVSILGPYGKKAGPLIAIANYLTTRDA